MSRTIRIRNKDHEVFTSNYERRYVNDVYAYRSKDCNFEVDVENEHKKRKERVESRKNDLQRDNKYHARSERGYSRHYRKKERADMRHQLYKSVEDLDYVIVDNDKKFSRDYYWYIVD